MISRPQRLHYNTSDDADINAHRLSCYLETVFIVSMCLVQDTTRKLLAKSFGGEK